MRFTTFAATAAVVLGLSGAAFAQSTGMQESVGTNAAGSKSGVVGKGDSMENMPAATGTTTMPRGEMVPARPMPSSDPAMAPRTGTAAPTAR